MAAHVIPVYRNDSGIEQFVPNDNGSCSRVPPGKAVKGDYYTGKLTSPKWSVKTDGSYDSLIVYENLGELGNRLTFVPIPAHSYSAGRQGQVAVATEDTGALTTIYVCWGQSGDVYTSTSTVTTGTGTKTFVTQTNLEEFLVPGSAVYIFSGADNMTGTVTSYDRLTGVLVTNITAKTGTSSLSSWTISSNRWEKSASLTATPW